MKMMTEASSQKGRPPPGWFQVGGSVRAHAGFPQFFSAGYNSDHLNEF